MTEAVQPYCVHGFIAESPKKVIELIEFVSGIQSPEDCSKSMQAKGNKYGIYTDSATEMTIDVREANKQKIASQNQPT